MKRLTALLSPTSTAPTYVGFALIAVGFGLIGVGWYQVSGLTDVSKQLPYVVSAALTGLGLIVVGATLVTVTARRQDNAARVAQLEELETLLSAGRES